MRETGAKKTSVLKFIFKPVDYLSVGWLSNERTWLTHGIHLLSTQKEIKRLGKAGMVSTHCPTSNMMLRLPVTAKNNDLEAAGCKSPGLGCGRFCFNDGSNMIAEIRMAMYLLGRHRMKLRFRRISLRRTALGNIQALLRQWGRTIGTLEVGKQADIAMFKR
ncbi:amidohydrolase family protein [Vibrio chagasii]|nr:amidohydrolase family protein [Vibrio chagasii]